MKLTDTVSYGSFLIHAWRWVDVKTAEKTDLGERVTEALQCKFERFYALDPSAPCAPIGWAIVQVPANALWLSRGDWIEFSLSDGAKHAVEIGTTFFQVTQRDYHRQLVVFGGGDFEEGKRAYLRKCEESSIPTEAMQSILEAIDRVVCALEEVRSAVVNS